jgi:hypothetical protein
MINSFFHLQLLETPQAPNQFQFGARSCWLDRARMALTVGRFADAERLARQSAAEAIAEKRADTEGYSWALLARPMLDQGEVKEARAALAGARSAVAAEKGDDAATHVAITTDMIRGAAAGYGPGNRSSVYLEEV